MFHPLFIHHFFMSSKLARLGSVFILAVIVLTGCNSGPDPVTFNDKMVKLQMQIAEKMKSFGEEIGSSAEVVKDDAMKKLDEMSKLVETNIAEVNKLAVPKGGDEFKNTVLGIFGYYKQVINTEFKQMVEILAKGDAITEADITVMRELQEKISKDEGTWDGKIRDAQAAYAKSVGMQIQ